MANDLKKTERIPLNVTERMLIDASREAALQDKSVNDLIYSILRSYLYGSVSRTESAFQELSK